MRSVRPPTHRPSPVPRAFTVAEIVLALTLLACGALAVVATTAAEIRAVGSAEAQLAATTAARNRLEGLAALGCSHLREGRAADSARGIRESWTIAHGRNGARLATDSVAYSDRGAARTVILSRFILC